MQLPILENVPCVLLENKYSATVEWNILYMCLMPILSKAYFKFNVSFVTDLTIVENGLFKSASVIMLLYISPLRYVSTCLIYLDAPMLDAYIFTIFISSSLFDSFVIIRLVSYSYLTNRQFVYISIAAVSHFWFPFVWNIFSTPLLSSYVCAKS